MRRIRLTESQFNELVSKCVKKCLNEGFDDGAKRIPNDLDEIMFYMVDYIDNCQDRDEVAYYLDEISSIDENVYDDGDYIESLSQEEQQAIVEQLVNTNIFQNSIGKFVGFEGNSILVYDEF